MGPAKTATEAVWPHGNAGRPLRRDGLLRKVIGPATAWPRSHGTHGRELSRVSRAAPGCTAGYEPCLQTKGPSHVCRH